MDRAGEELLTRSDSTPPTMVVLGREDKNVPFGVVRRLVEWADRTVIVPGGHEVQDVVPEGKDSYLEDVRRFIMN